MYQGFYNLTSGMLTQSRNLNVISNNMVNIQTAGYKSDTMVSTTFQEEMLIRTGAQYKENAQPLATTSKIKAADRTYTNYVQGSFDQTEGVFDFALSGNGFFCVQTADGERYTRNGAFYVDQEGYLSLAEAGRVLSVDNQPILITDENFNVDERGNITALIQTGETDADDDYGYGEYGEDEGGASGLEQVSFGQLKVVDFADYNQLHKEDNGLFSTGQAQTLLNQPDAPQTPVLWKMLEKSNVNMVQEMTSMMSAQRALQSAAQVLKMYDQVMSKASSEVGRL